MPDQPPSERFKAEMPQIPGVPAPGSPPAASHNSSLKLGIGLIAVLLVVFLGARWALRPQHTVPKPARPPQIEVPSSAPDPNNLLPHANDDAPGNASVEVMAKHWLSNELFIRLGLSGLNFQGMLIHN